MKATSTILFILLSINCFSQNETFFNVKSTGEGSPIIILESGLGEPLKNWTQVQDSLSKITQVISYDRLGLGESTSTNQPRTVENQAKELYKMLVENNVKVSCILVGHSLGGMIIRYFQTEHPEMVAGFVFVDSSNEYFHEKWFDSMPQHEADSIKKLMNDSYSKTPEGIKNEWNEAFSSSETMRKYKMPSNIPITILSSIKPNDPFDHETIDLKTKLEREWLEQAPQAKYIPTEQSGHYIQYQQPELVIGEIKKIVNQIRQEK